MQTFEEWQESMSSTKLSFRHSADMETIDATLDSHFASSQSSLESNSMNSAASSRNREWSLEDGDSPHHRPPRLQRQLSLGNAIVQMPSSVPGGHARRFSVSNSSSERAVHPLAHILLAKTGIAGATSAAHLAGGFDAVVEVSRRLSAVATGATSFSTAFFHRTRDYISVASRPNAGDISEESVSREEGDLLERATQSPQLNLVQPLNEVRPNSLNTKDLDCPQLNKPLPNLPEQATSENETYETPTTAVNTESVALDQLTDIDTIIKIADAETTLGTNGSAPFSDGVHAFVLETPSSLPPLYALRVSPTSHLYDVAQPSAEAFARSSFQPPLDIMYDPPCQPSRIVAIPECIEGVTTNHAPYPLSSAPPSRSRILRAPLTMTERSKSFPAALTVVLDQMELVVSSPESVSCDPDPYLGFKDSFSVVDRPISVIRSQPRTAGLEITQKSSFHEHYMPPLLSTGAPGQLFDWDTLRVEGVNVSASLLGEVPALLQGGSLDANKASEWENGFVNPDILPQSENVREQSTCLQMLPESEPSKSGPYSWTNSPIIAPLPASAVAPPSPPTLTLPSPVGTDCLSSGRYVTSGEDSSSHTSESDALRALRRRLEEAQHTAKAAVHAAKWIVAKWGEERRSRLDPSSGRSSTPDQPSLPVPHAVESRNKRLFLSSRSSRSSSFSGAGGMLMENPLNDDPPTTFIDDVGDWTDGTTEMAVNSFGEFANPVGVTNASPSSGHGTLTRKQSLIPRTPTSTLPRRLTVLEGQIRGDARAPSTKERRQTVGALGRRSSNRSSNRRATFASPMNHQESFGITVLDSVLAGDPPEAALAPRPSVVLDADSPDDTSSSDSDDDTPPTDVLQADPAKDESLELERRSRQNSVRVSSGPMKARLRSKSVMGPQQSRSWSDSAGSDAVREADKSSEACQRARSVSATASRKRSASFVEAGATAFESTWMIGRGEDAITEDERESPGEDDLAMTQTVPIIPTDRGRTKTHSTEANLTERLRILDLDRERDLAQYTEQIVALAERAVFEMTKREEAEERVRRLEKVLFRIRREV
ncbi:hypothetical protein M427DRAFT_45649 [Gonapodya prolifera JEL478]|uniref:Uncharacterized protein n=1 Tax=Gonapodya prolifera (strain JEL478) TaxID=1344416 RepID=A0A139A9V7_GONPJ|nr:hypothetical protein M427DRAFT_45649 [Gonapodya prolifera JEL478]|eukprot:KXS13517.1 hypothetical protein M427DRAFT_45649 [Gonapodya prolifera JEL478]